MGFGGVSRLTSSLWPADRALWLSPLCLTMNGHDFGITEPGSSEKRGSTTTRTVYCAPLLFERAHCALFRANGCRHHERGRARVRPRSWWRHPFARNSAQCARSKSSGAQYTVRVVVEPRFSELPGSVIPKSCPFIVRHRGDNHKARSAGHNDEVNLLTPPKPICHGRKTRRPARRPCGAPEA